MPMVPPPGLGVGLVERVGNRVSSRVDKIQNQVMGKMGGVVDKMTDRVGNSLDQLGDTFTNNINETVTKGFDGLTQLPSTLGSFLPGRLGNLFGGKK